MSQEHGSLDPEAAAMCDCGRERGWELRQSYSVVNEEAPEGNAEPDTEERQLSSDYMWTVVCGHVAVLNLWAMTPGNVEGLFHRGHLEPSIKPQISTL